MMSAPAPPKLRSTAEFLLDQIRELETRLAQSRRSVLLLAAEMRHLRATALILLYKSVADAACGRMDAEEIQDIIAPFVVANPRPVDVVSAALAAARAVIIAAYGRKRAQTRCTCSNGDHVAEWAVATIEKGVKTNCI
jgi:hypothetical protein